LKRLAIRGGNWNNGAIAGVFILNLNNARSNSNTNIGARPALGDRQMRQAYWACRQNTPQKDALSLVRACARNQNTQQADHSSSPCGRAFGSAALRGFTASPMAKTYNNLFPQVYAFDALHAAYLRARAGKRNMPEVQRFEADLEGNLIALQNELIWGSYRTGTYRTFLVHEPKERLVAALPFRDRVVQHALVASIEPIWERRFIADNYACRPGRGTHRGADRAQALLRQVKREHGKVYVLKGDIAKYFPSIDHSVLKGLLRKRIACQPTLALLEQIIDSADQVHPVAGVGLPIGNLTSQLCANIYLHELDEFAKHALREKHYIRYMDDFVIVSHDKAHLHQRLALIETFLATRLRLRTNSKTQVFPVGSFTGRALDFLGYRIWPTHRRVRKSSISRIKRTLRLLQKLYSRHQIQWPRVRQSITSWLEHAKHADAAGLRESVMSKFVFTRPLK
jgi:retron-type reverse transcriptase